MSHYTGSYEFGPYNLDSTKRVLKCAGETIPLTPKATEILVMLVMNAGQLVEKDELLKAVWPDTFVEESNLTQNIFILRRALDDGRTRPKYIETVARRGYRFVAPVRLVKVDEGTTGGHSGTQPPVIAVLPFLSSTAEADLKYLADGVTDNLINSLSRVSDLRVMSHSTVDRYKTTDLDPQQVGRELNANAVLVGKLYSRPTGVTISVELVDPATGWQMWGESFDSESRNILDIQEAITRQLLKTLRFKLTGEEEKRITARYTKNTEAYRSYLEGRCHWSRYTRTSIEKALGHFLDAIELDPNYTLAYAGIVDCYLRITTNYLPPDDHYTERGDKSAYESQSASSEQSAHRMRLRFEWDWKAVERELRRANDLKTDYPSALQWYFAYRKCKELYEESQPSSNNPNSHTVNRFESREVLPAQIGSLELTSAERLQILCAIVRDQIDIGNYAAGCKILQPWWSFGNRPKIEGLNQLSCADLLFTAGELAGFVASTVQLSRGQRHAEQLLNGSVALFEQLGLTTRAIEGRISLALCFHRQGLFDIASSTLIRVLEDLSEEDRELRSLALMRLGSLERHAGRVKDALARLIQATELAEQCGPWITARCYLELASTHKDLAISKDIDFHFNQARDFYVRAIDQFEAVGHHRYVAVVENNVGLLFLDRTSYDESERHLVRARRLFESLSDDLRGAQLNETLARLYIAMKRYEQAQEAIERAIQVVERTECENVLAEALTTAGIVAAKQQHHGEAKKNFEAACSVAERCGDCEGAGNALLVMLEELSEYLEKTECVQIAEKLKRLLAATQQTNLLTRVKKCLDQVSELTKSEHCSIEVSTSGSTNNI